MKIKRVNYKDKEKMIIDYQTEKDFQRLYCSDFPEVEFTFAMDKSRQILIDHMDLKQIPAERIEITSYELKCEVADERVYILGGTLKSTDGLTKTALKTQKLTRPGGGDAWLVSTFTPGEYPLRYLTEAEGKILEEVFAEAAKYVAGNRTEEQPELNFDDKKDEQKKEETDPKAEEKPSKKRNLKLESRIPVYSGSL